MAEMKVNPDPDKKVTIQLPFYHRQACCWRNHHCLGRATLVLMLASSSDPSCMYLIVWPFCLSPIQTRPSWRMLQEKTLKSPKASEDTRSLLRWDTFTDMQYQWLKWRRYYATQLTWYSRHICVIKTAAPSDSPLIIIIFKPPPLVGTGGGYMFSGRPSVPLSIRASVHPWFTW